MKATDLLKQQHRTIAALFTKIEDGQPGALKELASALAAHMAIEHEFFYPRAAKIDEDEVLQAFQEHALAEVALKRALASDADDYALEARVRVLEELVLHHFDDEEQNVCPQVEAELDLEELEELGAKMQARYDQVLALGYAAVIADNFEETTADIAQAEAIAPAA